MYYATYKDNTHTHVSSYVQWLPHICIMLRKMTKTHVYHDTYKEYHIMLRTMTKTHVHHDTYKDYSTNIQCYCFNLVVL